jgi:hypothetical protein
VAGTVAASGRLRRRGDREGAGDAVAVGGAKEGPPWPEMRGLPRDLTSGARLGEEDKEEAGSRQVRRLTRKQGEERAARAQPVDARVRAAGRGEARAGTAVAASTEATATRRCHLRQILVGANMRPLQHMLSNAPWPTRWVPPPGTRGIRDTARRETA